MRALILAAGRATRLRTLALDRPKAMLPIGGRPLLDHLVLWLREHGIRDIGINLHHRPEAIADHLGDGRRFGVSVTYAREERLLGTAGAIKNLQPFSDEPFVVLYGDVLTNLDLTALVQRHGARRSSLQPRRCVLFDSGRTRRGDPPTGPFLTLSLYRVANPSACGLVELDAEHRITRFVEKPSPSEVFTDLANAGVMVFEPGILDYIPERRVFDLGRDLFPRLLGEGVPLYGQPLRDGEFLIDIGTPESYRRARALYEDRELDGERSG